MVLEVKRDAGLSADAGPLRADAGGDPAGERGNAMDPSCCSRAAQVENLRMMLAAGTYEISAVMLAESILNIAIHGRRMRTLDRQPAGSAPPEPPLTRIARPGRSVPTVHDDGSAPGRRAY